ncbi:MAG: asparagine synthase (glutamine-hydrolyzing) [Planctomycetes bacterium]|nr:asparagine synthase (glutamine-hydrolyzing) [Planctomycetota bacterium]
MCGFVVVTGPGAERLARPAAATLVHRGPNDEGEWNDGRVALAHRRLSILDLSAAGRQPMASEDGSVVAVFNGEIYNYLELAREIPGFRARTGTDTEVLAEGFARAGRDIFSHLNGMFAAAFYEPGTGRLTLVRDRAGKKPLYLGWLDVEGGRRFAAASELRALLALPGFSPRISEAGLLGYLAYEYLPVPCSILEGVEKIPGGSWLSIDLGSGAVQKGEFWKPAPASSPGIPLDAARASHEFRELLADAVRLRLRSDVPLGVFLSGGLDSSTLAALHREVEPAGELHTFSIRFEEPTFDESSYARRVAGALRTQHVEETLSPRATLDILPEVLAHMDEPLADPSLVPTYLLCRLARRHVTVALSGDGGDEILAGYDPFRAWRAGEIGATLLGPIASAVPWETFLGLVLPPSDSNLGLHFKVKHFLRGLSVPRASRIQAWLSPFSPQGLAGVVSPDLAARGCAGPPFAPTVRAWSEAGPVPSLDRQIHVWFRTYLGEGVLTKVDRASMAHSLEVRSPFLDPRVVDYARRLPPSLKFHRGRGKRILRRAMTGRLPREILERPKKGFGIPIRAWLRGPLRDAARDALLARSLRESGLFRTGAIERLLDEHDRGRADHAKALWTLFVFARWRERWIKP